MKNGYLSMQTINIQQTQQNFHMKPQTMKRLQNLFLDAYLSGNATTFITEAFVTGDALEKVQPLLNAWIAQSAMQALLCVTSQKAQRIDSVTFGEEANNTWLVTAACAGELSTVTELIAKGANLDIRTDHGTSALYIAAVNDHLDIVKALLAAGANVNLCNDSGASALFPAVRNNNAAMVQLLLDSGANIDLQRKDGLTALQVAQKHGCERIVNLLNADKAKRVDEVTQQLSKVKISDPVPQVSQVSQLGLYRAKPAALEKEKDKDDKVSDTMFCCALM